MIPVSQKTYLNIAKSKKAIFFRGKQQESDTEMAGERRRSFFMKGWNAPHEAGRVKKSENFELLPRGFETKTPMDTPKEWGKLIIASQI
jgi:hypothetical protein